jgi:hypothetical protein
MTNNIQHNYLLNSLYLHFFWHPRFIACFDFAIFSHPWSWGAKKNTTTTTTKHSRGANHCGVSGRSGSSLGSQQPHELMVHPKFGILSIYMFHGLWHIMAYLCMYIRMHACMCIIYIYIYIYLFIYLYLYLYLYLYVCVCNLSKPSIVNRICFSSVGFAVRSAPCLITGGRIAADD